MAFTQVGLYADRSANEPGLAERTAPRSQPTTAQVLLPWDPGPGCEASGGLLPRLGHRSTGSARGVVKVTANSSLAELATAQEQPNAWKSSGLEHKLEACIVRNRCPAAGRPERGTCLAACVNSVLQYGGTPPSVLSATAGSMGRQPFLSRTLPPRPAPGRTRRRLRHTAGRCAPTRLQEPPRSLCGPPERPGRG